MLNRLTYISSLSHVRRVATPTDKSGKLIPPRKFIIQVGDTYVPAETPERQSVGVVKNLSYMSHIAIHSESEPLYKYVTPHIQSIDNLSPNQVYGKIKVFINGNIIGISDKPIKLYSILKNMKYDGIINIYTSIVLDYKAKELRVCNDSGRLLRPVLRVRENKLIINGGHIQDLKKRKLVWEDLLTRLT